MKEVSIIIVNYNTKELTKNCLASVFEKTQGVDFEVIVSDNGSRDGSIEMIRQEFPQVILIENNTNLGFGAANNRALKVASGKYIFYLNSDTVLLNNAAKMFFDLAQKNENCILGGFLYDCDGRIANSYSSFISSKKAFLRFLYNYFPLILKMRLFQLKNRLKICESLEVDYVTGADLFIAKKNFFELNGFDENFFMYFEDDDLCRRARKKGMRCIVFDGPKIMHLEGKSSKIKIEKLKILEKSCLYYYAKYSNEEKPKLNYFRLVMFLRFFSFHFTLRQKIELHRFSKNLIKQTMDFIGGSV